ncbi:hypothetical protein WICMUC_000373 [Wickerhamomyces mucosus]|uniref:Ubiquitin-conjugating enzyme E2-binding protein n=1 Tax=Wickerhamomyces mucosus TaxID=1378264 RepID=A0A9P8PXT2_9ASCO|nr:hypothetical protein WICMUC_000373 [Wickerhamomyces mucosus]
MNYYVESLSRIGTVSIAFEFQNSIGPIELPSKILLIDEKLIKLQFPNNDTGYFIPLSSTVSSIPQNCSTIRNNTLLIKLPSSNQTIDRSKNELMEIKSQWDSKYLSNLPNFIIRCVKCNTILIDSKNISKISEMPSELWAEMMDFWHCHKPNDNLSYPEHYNSIKPIENAILIGSYYISKNLKDFSQTILEKKSNKINQLNCFNCDNIVGEFDKSTSLDKIFKWEISINEEIFKPYQFIYSNLLENVNKNATRIIEFISKETSKKLLIWVFNIGVDFILSGGFNSQINQDSLKVYYTTNEENIIQERNNRGEIETVFVLEKILTSTINRLDEINKNLPTSLKTMGKNWNLALLMK